MIFKLGDKAKFVIYQSLNFRSLPKYTVCEIIRSLVNTIGWVVDYG